MARPSKLTPEQWGEVDRRALAGESARALGREFSVSEAAIRKRLGSRVLESTQVRTVAEKLAEANTALAALPEPHRVVAVGLAEKLRSISTSMAAAAELGAKTAHRLHALANSEASKIDDAQPLRDREALQGVAALLKLGNDAGVLPANLISASKEAVAKAVNPPEEAEKAPPVRERLSMDEWRSAHGL